MIEDEDDDDEIERGDNLQNETRRWRGTRGGGG